MWRTRETAENRRLLQKPKMFAENHRKPQIAVRHLGSVTLSSVLSSVSSESDVAACRLGGVEWFQRFWFSLQTIPGFSVFQSCCGRKVQFQPGFVEFTVVKTPPQPQRKETNDSQEEPVCGNDNQEKLGLWIVLKNLCPPQVSKKQLDVHCCVCSVGQVRTLKPVLS